MREVPAGRLLHLWQQPTTGTDFKKRTSFAKKSCSSPRTALQSDTDLHLKAQVPVFTIRLVTKAPVRPGTGDLALQLQRMLPDVAGHPETQLIAVRIHRRYIAQYGLHGITGNQLIVRPETGNSAAHRDRQPANTALYEPTAGMMRSGARFAEHHLIRELRRYGRAVNRPQHIGVHGRKPPDT